MRNADPRAYGTGGIWPLQHHGYKADGWKLSTRNGMVAYRIKGQLRGTGDLGHWLEEERTRGDVTQANMWQEQEGQRDCPGWSWLWPATIILQAAASGPQPSVPTGIGQSVATGGGPTPQPQPQRPSRRGGNAAMSMLPVASGVKPDARFEPKQALIPLMEGSPDKDPNSPPPPAPPPGQQNTLFLGIGASATGQGFGGPGVGFGFGFASFSGVRTNFSSGTSQAGASFSGVRTNFSQGGSRVGATFRFNRGPRS